MFLDRSMQRHDRVAAFIFTPRQANITDNANQPAARNQRLVTMKPDLIQFGQKSLVIGIWPSCPFVSRYSFSVQ